MNLLIYNPVSGLSRNELTDIEDQFMRYKRALTTIQTSLECSLDKQLNKVNMNEIDNIIVAGGDGTVSQAMEYIVKLNFTGNVLIYPKGTTNEFASNFGITKDTLNKFLENDFSIVKTDIGEFNHSNVFSYSLVFGNFTDIPYETPQWLKNRVGYWAYWLYGFFTMYLLRLKKYEMKLLIEEKEITGDFLFGSISNSYTLGRVINLNDVEFNDGLFELFLVESPKSFKEVINFLHDIRMNENNSKLFHQYKINYLEIKSKKYYPWSADGEFSGDFDIVTFSISHYKLNLIV